MNENRFNSTTKILIGIVIAMLILNLLAFRSILSISSNKTILIQVPQVLESGKYAIGSTFASNNVYRMWTRLWIESLANFSYLNVEKRVSDIYPYLAPETAFKNKSNLLTFISAMKQNYVTQKYNIQDIFISNEPKGFKKIVVYGKIYRTIGGKKDTVYGSNYVYEIIAFVRNGQVYIKNLNAHLATIKDSNLKQKLLNDKRVDYSNEINAKYNTGIIALRDKRNKNKKQKKLEEAKKKKEALKAQKLKE